jgi:hypothetical protein
MSLIQQIREVPLSYGQQLIMKRMHSLNSMTTNIMKKYRPNQTWSSHYKPTRSPVLCQGSLQIWRHWLQNTQLPITTLTTTHTHTPYDQSPQGDRSYQDAIHPRTGSPHSLTHTSNHYAVHFPPTSRIPIIFYKPYSTSPHHYHLTPFLPQLM